MTREERLQAEADRAITAQSAALWLKRNGRLTFLADDEHCPDMMRLAALTEELGEVARALHDNQAAHELRLELDQLAGIALAWASIL